MISIRLKYGLKLYFFTFNWRNRDVKPMKNSGGQVGTGK